MYKYEYNSLHDLLTLAEKEGTTLADIVVRHEVESSEVSEEKVRAMMDSRLDVFQESIDAGMNDPGKSVSGLVGGDAHKLAESTPTLLGALAHKAAIYALAVSEANAKMFKIVACPTAGSCGIVPAVMMAEAETLNISREVMVNALFIASGIGAVVSHNATVAGAVGGCQAECGTAAAASMAGGSNDTILQAFALCLKNTLGLACDPVAGLVEVPCVKRNAVFAVEALAAAEMALAGIQSVIPPDEVITAMAEIGRIMPVALKETSDGGLARTETGKAIAARLEKAMEA